MLNQKRITQEAYQRPQIGQRVKPERVFARIDNIKPILVKRVGRGNEHIRHSDAVYKRDQHTHRGVFRTLGH